MPVRLFICDINVRFHWSNDERKHLFVSSDRLKSNKLTKLNTFNIIFDILYLISLGKQAGDVQANVELELKRKLPFAGESRKMLLNHENGVAIMTSGQRSAFQ